MTRISIQTPRRPRVRTLVVALATLTATTSLALADYRINANPGAASLGRGGGNIALEDGPSAIRINPANLTHMETGRIEFSPSYTHGRAKYTALGKSEESIKPHKFLGGLNIATPIKGTDVTVGVGVNTPYGLSARLDKDFALRYHDAHFAELRYVGISPTVAMKLGKNFSVGLGAEFAYANASMRFAYPWSAVTGSPLSPDGELQLDTDGWGVGAIFGASYQPAEGHNIGFRVKLPVDVETNGTTRLTNNPLVPRSMQTTSLDVELQFPLELGLGYGVQVTDKLRVGADVEWIRWSEVRSTDLGIGGVNSAFIPGSASSIPRNWEDTVNVGAGFDYKLSDEFTLRGGYQFVESAIPDKYYTLSIPGADRHVLSVGLGYKNGPHSIDLAYSHSIGKDRDITDHVNPAMNGHYELYLRTVTLSYSFDF